MRILVYVLIGLAIGGLSGLFGIGGGVLLVPALMWLCYLDQKKAAGTSLAILVPPIMLPAALEAWREDRVDLQAALWIAASYAVGSWGGQRLLTFIQPEAMSWLRVLFGLLMMYVAGRFILSSDSEALNAAAGLASAALAWVAYLGLRALGRHALAPSNLGDEIRRRATSGDQTEYHI